MALGPSLIAREDANRLERERAELLGQMAAYRQELENAPTLKRARREWLEWQVRRDEKRVAEVEGRLAERN